MAATLPAVKPWTSRKIPFESFDSHPLRTQIADAMKEIEAHTPIRFTLRGNEPSWIYFENNQGDPNQAFGTGMITGGLKINLKFDWLALHEICHAIGLIHEHCRSDSQNYIDTFFRTDNPHFYTCTTLRANSPDGNCDPADTGVMGIECTSLHLTEYDRYSITHYRRDMGYMKDMHPPTMEWQADADDVGPKDWNKLSSLDIVGLKLFYGDDNGWAAQTRVRGFLSRHSPAVIPWRGQLHMFWNGRNNEDGIFGAVSDGKNWSRQARVPGILTKNGPACAVVLDKLLLVWNGYEEHNDALYWRQHDGKEWSEQKVVPGVGTTKAPALAQHHQRAYAAWKGVKDTDGLFFASFNGYVWGSQARLSNGLSKVAPSLAVVNGVLYAAWTGINEDGIYYASFDGTQWSGQQKISHFASSTAPTITEFPDPYNPKIKLMHLSWRGLKDDDTIWWACGDPARNLWSGQIRNPFRTDDGPAMTAFRNRMFMAWSGHNGDGVYGSYFSIP
jgi:hypothetical protein